MFVAPSDPSGIGSMRHEFIQDVPSWQRGPARYDCTYISTDDTKEGMLGMDIARVDCFFFIDSYRWTKFFMCSCPLV